MGKKSKEHRKKVAKRNEKIQRERKSQEKVAMDFLMKMIQREKQSGAFESPVQPMPNFDGPVVDSNDSTTFVGPQL